MTAPWELLRVMREQRDARLLAMGKVKEMRQYQKLDNEADELWQKLRERDKRMGR